MKPTRSTPRPWAEPLARQHHPRHARRRDPRPLHRRALVTGLTSNPTIFDKAITGGDDLRRADLRAQRAGHRARGDLLRPRARRTCRAPPIVPHRSRAERRRGRLRVDGGLAASGRRRPGDHRAGAQASRAGSDGTTSSSRSRARKRDARRSRSRSTPASPINVTLLFSTDQYLGAAEAYMRGIERRIADGLDPGVRSVASLFMSRWDVAVADEVTDELRNRLGIAVGKHAYRAYRELLDSDRFEKLAGERGRLPPAPAVREHRDQGPERLRRPLRRGARGAGHDQHDARQDAARVRGPRGGRRADPARRRGRGRRRWPSSSPRASTRTSSPPAFSGRARSPSTRAGTTSWNRSTSKSHADSRQQGEQGLDSPSAAPERSIAMQLGMIGLGRMGANMVRRLMKRRPRVRGLRRVPGLGEGARRRGGRRARSRWRTSASKLEKPRGPCG